MSNFALYRVAEPKKENSLWQLSYFDVMEKKLPIRESEYRQICLNHGAIFRNVLELCRFLKDRIKVSDVLVLNANGEVTAYYIDEQGPHKLAGFLTVKAEGTVISPDTMNYQMEGYQGKWRVVDYMIIDGKQFYLMEHQEFHEQSNQVILDGYGKLITETGKAGFDQQAKQKLHEYVRERQQEHPEEQNNQKNQENPDWQKRMQRYQDKLLGSIQKSQKGGSGGNAPLEKSEDESENLSKTDNPQIAESTTDKGAEQSGNVNEKKKKSIVRRLHRHQAEIAVKEGKQVSKYLKMQLEREKKK